ncbi:lyase family protein [Lapillicoccus jejuensis]|uniref:3-carboxy-cis,cis-muconate cycloisomerase n=1 Tax=Lapillicoccus jejuensis TaxID=402171 RepID=A0A542E3N6_9MICO|nr:lyase family protein [Lapillicoccus jejuensis]TQJ09951.1 3-carboxy-cis,cis-muconate cycloisomerase [Lapillicoccus jejuensis]
MSGLLEPGAARGLGLADDEAVLEAMVDVESAWLRVQGRLGLLTPDEVAVAARDGLGADDLDAGWLADWAEGAGNPVPALVEVLRAGARGNGVPDRVVTAIHRGLTSQDVVDTALVLVSRQALTRMGASLTAAGDAAARLAREHRDTLMLARTLTQPALPTTFGYKVTGWLGALDDAVVELRGVVRALPVQCGGAAGTLAAVEVLAPTRATLAVAMLAEELGLVDPGRPWHTDRGAMTRIGDVLVRCADVLGKIAADVLTLSRPEIGELQEPAAAGRGGSSTLPQKRNPVLSVLVRSVAIEAPYLGATLHAAAGLAVDERPDGAWHAEWGALLRLLRRVLVAGDQVREVLDGLVVDPTAMARNVWATGPDLLAERRHLTGAASDTDDDGPLGYLGVAVELVERAVDRHRSLDPGGPA